MQEALSPIEEEAVEEIVQEMITEKEVKYAYPQPDIPRGTRVRKFAKNQRNQPCICGSGKKFKHCCIDTVTSKSLYTVQ